jgi:hypothetical protein
MTGQKTVYLNQPIEVLKYLTVASVKSNEVEQFVWKTDGGEVKVNFPVACFLTTCHTTISIPNFYNMFLRLFGLAVMLGNILIEN